MAMWHCQQSAAVSQFIKSNELNLIPLAAKEKTKEMINNDEILNQNDLMIKCNVSLNIKEQQKIIEENSQVRLFFCQEWLDTEIILKFLSNTLICSATDILNF